MTRSQFKLLLIMTSVLYEKSIMQLRTGSGAIAVVDAGKVWEWLGTVPKISKLSTKCSQQKILDLVKNFNESGNK